MKHVLLSLCFIAVNFLSFGQIPTADLIKEYYLTNGDLTNNNNPGTYDLVPTGASRSIIADPIGTPTNALSLNGDQFAGGVRGTTTGVANGDVSVSFWMRTSVNNATPQIIFEQEGPSGFGNYGWFVELVNGKVRVRASAQLNGAGISSQIIAESAVMADNNWHHFVCVVHKYQFFSGGWNYGPRAIVYMDNVWQDDQYTGGASNLSLIYINPMAEQVYLSTGASNYTGDIDNIRVYNRFISPTDVTALYQEYAAGLTRFYVDKDATGSNNGSSWANAYVDLQTALAATTTQEIWVAEGTYTPHAVDRTVSFSIPTGINIYGGFNGTETLLSERNWLVNKTILSGDLLGNDAGAWGYTEVNRGDNSYHVVVINGDDVTLDGLTVSDGHANGAGYDYYAGGIIMNYTANSANIINCVLEDNVARVGSGLFARFGAGAKYLNFTNSTFHHNLGASTSGFYCFANDASTVDVNVTSCLFSENVATDNAVYDGSGGAAFYVYAYQTGSTVNLQCSNTTFVKNESSGTGAGIDATNRCVIGASQLNGTANAEIDNCIFWGNTQLGGGPAVATGVLFSSPPALLTAENSIDENGFANILPGNQTNTSSVDPLFANFSGGNYNLSCSSPAVNTGDATGLTLPSTDIENTPRTVGTIDMGAFEFENPNTSITASTSDVTVYLDGSGNASITTADVDNNSGTACGVAFTLSLDNSTFNCSNLGPNTVNLTATETVSTNSDVAAATVTVLDTISPTAVVQNITVPLNSSGIATIIADDIDNGSSDNCSGFTTSIDISSFDCSDIGVVPVTLTIQDASGNTKTAIASVTIVDNLAPVAIAQNITVQLDAAGQITVPTLAVDNGTTDNCSFTLALSVSSFDCSNIGPNSVLLTATDPSGNAHAVPVTITVEAYIDDEALTASPQSVCSAGSSATVTVAGSVSGIDYFLRDDSNNSIIDGPINGTGSALNFSTGPLAATTTFNVFAQQPTTTYALNMDGVNDLISLGTNTRGVTTQFTIACWVKPAATGVAKYIASKYNGTTGFSLFLNASGKLLLDGRDGAGVYRSTGASTTTVADGNWHYVAGTINVSTGVWSVYVDGVLENSVSLGTGTTLANTSQFYVGNYTAPTGTGYLQGDIDQISVWSSALNASQIVNTMNNCLTGAEANLVGLFHMEDGSGTLLNDESPSNLDALMNNMDPLNDWIPGMTNPCIIANPACDVQMSQTITINVGDITAPQPDVATLADVNGSCSLSSLAATSATDNCAGSVAGTHNATFPITSSTVVTWTYDDGNGNTATQTQNVNIIDATGPAPDLASLPAVNAQCEVTSFTAPTATDNCAGAITGTHNATFPISSNTTVTWTYDDGNGNTSTQTQNVVINDNTAPVADLGSLTTLTASCSITSLTAPTATDNCAGAITGTTGVSLPINASTTITWSYDDGNGNTSTQTQNVVINDNTAPVPSVATLADITAQCEVTSLTAPTANDNCTGLTTGTHGATLPITSSTTITWTYDDGNGNTSTQTQSIVINDVTAPTADVASLSALSAQCEITSLTAPTASDNCVGSVIGTHNATLPITSSSTITWTYDDGNGNTTTQTQNVVINDNTAPTADLATLADVNGQCSVTSLSAPTATDNCVGSITGTHNATFPITANTTVTWTYDDGNGNTTTQTQNVVINDNTPPVPDLATLPNVLGECSVTSLTNPSATDNCSAVLVTSDAVLPITTSTTITWSYTDNDGNVATQTQNVVIDDVTAPVTDLATLTDITEQCEVTSLTAPTATDNCAGSLTGTHNATLPITSTTTVTWTYDDGEGNTTTQTQNVIISDNQAPVADVATLTDLTAACEITSWVQPTATDNCLGAITATTTSTLPISSSTTITWTYVDGNGNTTTQAQNVIISDNTAPVEDLATLADINEQCEVTGLIAPTATDNCLGTITGTHNATLPISTSTLITWTYDDGNGNITTQDQQVNIADATAPIADVTTLADIAETCEVTALTAPTATDNCSGTVTGTHNATLPITATTTITWTYTDGNGNATTQDQEVIISSVDAGVSLSGFTITADNGTADGYQWVDCNNGNAAIAGETGQAFTPTANGSYAVEVTIGSCTETSACEVISTIGLDEKELIAVSIYPNPTLSGMNIVTEHEILNVAIFDVTGALVQEETQASFSVEHLARGTYTLRITTDRGVARKRFVKE